jgi:hypothetical protein
MVLLSFEVLLTTFDRAWSMAGSVTTSHNGGRCMQKMSIRGAAAPVTSLPTWLQNIAISGRKDLAVGRTAPSLMPPPKIAAVLKWGLDYHSGHATLGALLRRCGQNNARPPC